MSNKKIFILALSLFALLGASCLLYATRFGAGLPSDSIVFTALARRLLQGHGLTLIDFYQTVDPVSRFPPLYPLLLAASTYFGLDVFEGARALNVGLFFMNIMLVGLIAYRLTDRSIACSLLSTFLFMWSVDVLTYHSLALSEVPFLFFLSLAFLSMLEYLESGGTSWYLLSALASGLSVATRYAGLGWIGAASVALMVLLPKKEKSSQFKAVLFAGVGLLPFAAWSLRNRHFHTEMIGRSLSVHAFWGMDQWQNFKKMLGVYIANDSHLQFLFLLMACCVIGALGIRLWRSRHTLTKGWKLALFFIVGYTAMLLLTATFLQADLFFVNDRLFLPIHVFFIVFAVQSLYRAGEQCSVGVLFGRTILFGVCVFFLLGGFLWINTTKYDGQDYASRVFKESPLIRKIQQLPPQIDKVYTNLPWPIELYTDKRCSLLPLKVNNSDLKPNGHLESDLRQMLDVMSDGETALVFFRKGDSWFEMPSLSELQGRLPLRQIAKESDGAIFVAPKILN